MSSDTYLADWYQSNKDYVAGYYAQYRDKTKLEMVTAYGGKCVHCGESDPVVLVTDHIHNDGAEWRKQNKRKGGFAFYRWLKAQGWPKDTIQLLCHNCNYRKEVKRRRLAVEARVAEKKARTRPAVTVETRAKLSKALKGVPKSEAHKQALRKPKRRMDEHHAVNV